MNTVMRVLTAVLAIAFAVATAAPAAANGDEETSESRVLVLQAIAFIVNTPGDTHTIAEHIEHAIEAEHQEGVDLDLVEKAETAVAQGDLTHARELLQTSIGAGPAVGHGVPEPVLEHSGEPGEPAFATAAETGTTLVLASERVGEGIDGGDIALLVLAAAAVVLGAAFGWRLRPPDTVRALRRAARAREGEAR